MIEMALIIGLGSGLVALGAFLTARKHGRECDRLTKECRK